MKKEVTQMSPATTARFRRNLDSRLAGLATLLTVLCALGLLQEVVR